MERSYQLDSALEGLTGSAIRTFIDGLLSGIDRALSAVIRIGVQIVFTMASKRWACEACDRCPLRVSGAQLVRLVFVAGVLLLSPG
jgi:hypothetical protein